jgi:HK97 family phage portal protein
MTIPQRIKAAVAILRGKGIGRETVELNQLLDFLGIKNVKGEALSEATYFACLKVLSESIGKLPLKLQQYTQDKGIRIAREHPYYRMLNSRPNRFMTASTFWSLMELCEDHYGNGYAWIDTRDITRPQLWPMDPASVQVVYDNACKLSDVPDVYYKYSTKRGVEVYSSEEVLHFKSHLTVDGLVGISVREQLANTIQGNVKAQALLNRMTDSGMTAKAVLQYTGSLSDANVQTLKEGIDRHMQGDLDDKDAKNIIPIPFGFSLTPLNMKLADSQFLELRQYSALQIASAFGVKPYQVGDYTKSSYASAEAQQLSFLVDTLLFKVKQKEEEVAYKLLSDTDEANGLHAKFNTGVMLRADQKTQIETLRSAVTNFLMTPNEAREKIDLPRKEGGDQLIGNGSTIPITAVGEQWKARNTPQSDETDEDEEEPKDENETPKDGEADEQQGEE